jgi:mRNA-degrading endonuclease RelE of RelBE toxin-antitoxin system
MRLVIAKRAAKDLQKIAEDIATDILKRMAAIAADPFAMHANVERLQGRKDSFRMRKGDFRALYVVERERDTVVLERVMNRSEAYR